MKGKHQNPSEREDHPDTEPDLNDGAAEREADGAEQETDAVVEDAPQDERTDKKYADLMDRYQRQLAEFDNFRKRTNKEKAAMYDDGTRDTVEKLLPIIDNFERALAASDDKEDKFYQGVAMIARQLDTTLQDLGVELIPAARGESFDHNFHFAVAHVEDEALGESVISEELQKGYKHKDKVIRPSMVRVAN